MMLLFALMALQDGPLSLRLAAVQKDAVFIDTKSISREGPRRSFRILRIVTGDNPINGDRFYGGWQKVVVDCQAKTFRALTFASLRENGVTGPESALPGKPFAIAGGSVEEGLRKAACDSRYYSPDRAGSVEEAASLGRQRIEDAIDAQLGR